MQKPSEHHKLTSDNNIIKFKKPVHDPFKGGLTDLVFGLSTAFGSQSAMIHLDCK